METKHTPGPWTDKGGSTGAVWAGREFIASVYPNAQEDWDGFSRYDRQDETEANARLVAASPELLDACETAMRLIRAAGLEDRIGTHEIRAAIAKATQP